VWVSPHLHGQRGHPGQRLPRGPHAPTNDERKTSTEFHGHTECIHVTRRNPRARLMTHPLPAQPCPNKPFSLLSLPGALSARVWAHQMGPKMGHCAVLAVSSSRPYKRPGLGSAVPPLKLTVRKHLVSVSTPRTGFLTPLLIRSPPSTHSTSIS